MIFISILTADDVEVAVPTPSRAILSGSLTAAEAACHSGTPVDDAVLWAKRERIANRLFGVWSSYNRAFVHPKFQFNEEHVHPYLFDLLGVLKQKAGFDPQINDKGGWARAYWLHQPRAELSAQALALTRIDAADPVTVALTVTTIGGDRPRSPAEIFATEPLAVIALAKTLVDEATSSSTPSPLCCNRSGPV